MRFALAPLGNDDGVGDAGGEGNGDGGVDGHGGEGDPPPGHPSDLLLTKQVLQQHLPKLEVLKIR